MEYNIKKDNSGMIGTLCAIISIVLIVCSAFFGIVPFVLGIVVLGVTAVFIYKSYTSDNGYFLPLSLLLAIVALAGAGIVSVFSIVKLGQ